MVVLSSTFLALGLILSGTIIDARLGNSGERSNTPIACSQSGQGVVTASPMKIEFDVVQDSAGIRFHLAASNISKRAAPLRFNSPNAVFVFVRDSSGALVWSNVPDYTLADVLREEWLQPGQVRAFDVRWDQISLKGVKVSAGRYEATARFDAEIDNGKPVCVSMPLVVAQRLSHDNAAMGENM